MNVESLKKVMLVDDHAIVRIGIASILEKSGLYHICCEASGIGEMIELLEKHAPELVLLDYMLPDGDGASGCRMIKKRYPQTKVLIISALNDQTSVREAAAAGADGYLIKDIDRKVILETVNDIMSGKLGFNSVVLEKLIDSVRFDAQAQSSAEALTAQEEEILALVAKGMTNKEISQKLYIAEKTVRNYLSRIMRKIEVSNRTEAALFWNKNHKG